MNASRTLTGLEVILKVAERCNINCSYCYYFNGGNEEYTSLPKFMSDEVFESATAFIEGGIDRYGLKAIQIDFHGGEPTLLKKETFDRACTLLRDRIERKAALTLAIQTNATLIDDDWVELFAKHKVGVGISLDGPKAYNDRFRLDHRGLSTYDASADGIARLSRAVADDRITPLAALCVVDPEVDPKSIYRHFVDNLGFAYMDFLLPDHTHDDFDFGTVEKYGRYLCSLFDAWQPDFKSVRVRIIDSFLSQFTDNRSSYAFTEALRDSTALVVQSNGDLGPDDTLRTTDVWRRISPRPNLAHTSLEAYLDHPHIQALGQAERSIPTSCQDCCWAKACGGGGNLAHQYSSVNQSCDNPSVHCGALKEFYAHVCAYLVNNGYPVEQIEERLGVTQAA